MPQLQNTLRLFIRFGGYEPSVGLHTEVTTVIAAATQFGGIKDSFLDLICAACEVSRFELQDPNGTIIGGAAIAESGTYANVFADMRDMSHITWASAGTDGPSGMFIPARPVDAYLQGNPTVGYEARIQAFAGAVFVAGYTDSEGSPLTGVLRHRPSRRPNVRVAP